MLKVIAGLTSDQDSSSGQKATPRPVLDGLRAALEARDGGRLLRLCGELSCNPTMTLGECEAPLTHHIARAQLGQQGLECLRELIQRFETMRLTGLTAKDKSGQSFAHVAAQYQDDSWLQLIRKSMDKTCFEDIGSNQRTAVHCAALNTRSDSALKWLVGQLGSKCLLETDAGGNTPIHLAALTQGPETMKYITKYSKSLFKEKDKLFELTGGQGRTVMHLAAMSQSGPGTLLWLMSKCKKDKFLVRDSDGSTPVHLAALYQDTVCMAAMNKAFGSEVFQVPAKLGDTAVHCAAMNVSNNCVLAWCARNLDPACMRGANLRGVTPVHLAAQFQGLGPLHIVRDSLGTSTAFKLSDAEGRTVADYAGMNPDRDRVLEWLAGQGLLPSKSVLTKQKTESDASLRAPPVADIAGRDTQDPIAEDSEDRLGPVPSPPSPSTQRQRPTKATASKLENAEPSEKPAAAPVKPLVQTPVEQPVKLVVESPPVDPRRQPSFDRSFTTWEYLPLGSKKVSIGSGTFGTVYQALTDKHQVLAVKVVKFQGSPNVKELAKTIERERKGIEVLTEISHPNIVEFVKSERLANDKFCIFTELVTGHSLFDLMKLRKKPFDEAGIGNFSRQICTALNFLHSRKPAILHRDIKCSNIMLNNEGIVKLIDFGLAKEIFSTSVGCITAHPCGTWHYMAPELYADEDRLTYTPKTDVWAFGCVVFEMATMLPPNSELPFFKVQDAICRRGMPDLPPEVSAVLRDFYRRCVAKESRERADTTELQQHPFLTG